MAAMEVLAQIGKGVYVSLDNSKEVVQSFLLVPVKEPAAGTGDTAYLSFDADSIRALKADRPESNTRQVQYAVAVVTDAFSGPLCSNLGNHAKEAGLVVLLVAA